MYVLEAWYGYYDEGNNWVVGVFNGEEKAREFGEDIKKVGKLHDDVVEFENSLPWDATEEEVTAHLDEVDRRYGELQERYGKRYQGEVWGYHIWEAEILDE